jgi:CHASE3 domain sensor protein
VTAETTGPTGRQPASLRRRVLTIAAFAGVGVTVLIGYSARVVLDVRDTLDEQRMVLLPALLAADEFETATREQQRGERGYVITQDRTYLEPYERNGPIAVGALADLRRLAAGDPELMTQVEEAAEARQRWFDEAARPAVAAVDRGEPDQAVATVSNLGRQRFEDFITEVSDVEQRINVRTDAVEQKLFEGEERLLRLLISAGLAASSSSRWCSRRWSGG